MQILSGSYLFLIAEIATTLIPNTVKKNYNNNDLL